MVKPGGKILLIGECQEGVGAPEFREMVAKYSTDHEFMRAIEGVPVTVDQWQLEKLALATVKAQVLFYVPGVPAEYRKALWGLTFDDPCAAVAGLLDGLPKNARVAVVPEGPYVLAQAR